MKITNKLIISLAAALSGINIFLILLREDDIAIYFIADAITYLIVALSFPNLNPKSRKALNRLGTVIFMAFLTVIVIQISAVLELK